MTSKAGAAVLRTSILTFDGLDSIGILFQRGEIPQTTGSSPLSSTRRMLVRELLVGKTAVAAERTRQELLYGPRKAPDREFHEPGFCGIFLRGFGAGSSSPQISAILVGHFTGGEMIVSAILRKTSTKHAQTNIKTLARKIPQLLTALSNLAPSRNRPFVAPHTCHVHIIRVKDQHTLLRYSPRLKKTCVRQVVLDKWFPLVQATSKGFLFQIPLFGSPLRGTVIAAVAARRWQPRVPAARPCGGPGQSRPTRPSRRRSRRSGYLNVMSYEYQQFMFVLTSYAMT